MSKKIIVSHSIVVILSITLLGSIYLLMGHNSVGFTLLCSLIAGVGGYIIPSPIQKC